jgi:hypothetical protein
MSCSLIVVSCIGFGAYGRAWVWRLNVLSPGPFVATLQPMYAPSWRVYVSPKNVVQYQSFYVYLHSFHRLKDLIS